METPFKAPKRRTPRSAVAALGLVLLCVGCGGATSDAGAVRRTVEARCEGLCKRLTNLQCPAESTYCKDDCVLRQSFAPWCDAAGSAAVDCVAEQSDSSFVCGATGAEAKNDVCTAERRAFQRCLYEGPLPDMTQDCAAYSRQFSDLVSSLGCGQALSADACLLALDDRIPCNGALAVYIHCNAHEPASSFACTEGGPAPKPDSRCAPYAFPLVECVQPP